ncbi:MAG: hydroxymethylbilane synthase [Chloroflexota bacterium]|nr:hydroxymethylbilane synthase [Chloroflexota bacterium]
MSSSSQTLTIGTRASDLALWQTHHIIERLQAAWPGLTCLIKPIVTIGDQTQASGQPLPAIGGKGLFTEALEHALRCSDIDLAVHSLKDLPVDDAPGLLLGAITSRADVRDVLIARNGWTLATLPTGAIVGTSSTRRAAQLLAARRDLTIRSIRGNVGTRIQKVLAGDYDATLLAAAGVERLGLLAAVTEWLPLTLMLPAPGQGALAVQCRADDLNTRQLLAPLNDLAVRMAVTAERSFLQSLGGGCSAPVAAYATVVGNPLGANNPAYVQMQALVASPDGHRLIRVQGEGAGLTLGSRLARQAIEQGATSLIAQAQPPAVTVAGADKPLHNKRIVITRPREQAGELYACLADLGAAPLAIPVIQIVPLPDLKPLEQAIGQLAQYAWLLFTSANAVTLFCEHLQQHSGDLGAVKVAAVGTATAAVLRQHGIEPTFVPAEFVAAKIAAGLGDVAGQRILWPQALLARPEVSEQLTAHGATVDAIPIYKTLPIELELAHQLELAQGVDVILFTSGSTVRHFMAALAHKQLDLAALHQPRIACIGPVTAQTAHELGLHVDIVAAEHTTVGLVQALTAYFQKDVQGSL